MVAGQVEPAVLAEAEALLSDASVGAPDERGGGATALVQADPGWWLQVWVGVVDGGLVAECDCTDDPVPGALPGPGIAGTRAAGPEAAGGGLCAHAVATVLRAVREGFAWSSAAVPPSTVADDPGPVDL